MAIVIINGKETRVNYILDDTGNDGFDEGDDLREGVKETLNSYLSAEIAHSSNAFKVDDKSNTEPPVFNIDQQSTPSFGVSAELPDYAFLQSVKKRWWKPDKESVEGNATAHAFDTLSTSEFFEGKLGFYLNKSKRSKQQNKFLSAIKGVGGYRGVGYQVGNAKFGTKVYDKAVADGAPPVQMLISSALAINRFTPHDDTPFIRDGSTKNVISHAQGELGAYKADGVPVTLEQLRNVGLALTIRATGHASAGESTVDMGIDDAVTSSNAIQEGSEKANVVDLLAQTVMEGMGVYGKAGGVPLPKFEIPDSTIFNDFVDGIEADDVVNLKSFGQLNSPIEPFSSPNTAGMIALSVMAMLSISAAAYLVGLLMATVQSIFTGDFSSVGGALLPGFSRPDDDPERPNPLGDPGTKWWNKKGVNRPHRWYNWFFEMMGIPYTRTSFNYAIGFGTSGFYGMDGSMGGFLAAAVNLLQSPGYYAGIVRGVVRDMSQVDKAFSDFSDAMGSFMGALGALDNILSAMANTTLWRWMMTMAGIGDALACKKFRLFSPTSEPVDMLADYPVNRIKKSRTAPHDPTLVWRCASAPSLYLLSVGQQIAETGSPESSVNVGTTNGIMAMGGYVSLTETAKDVDQTNYWESIVKQGSIDSEFVEIIERRLDGEYVPFYFHDLRTNEVLAFHAFLTNLGEVFSPQWTTESAFGRVDDVQIYNKTSRSLNVSFVVAATSKNDFDRMWYKINRFIAMVYPQWTVGKPLVTADNKIFTMPFSQIPSASPIIRLRVGDLISTNYSKFNLARLFGASNPGVQSSFAGSSPSAVFNASAEHQDAVAAELAKYVDAAEIDRDFLEGSYVTFGEAQKRWIHPAGEGGVMSFFGFGDRILTTIPVGSIMKVTKKSKKSSDVADPDDPIPTKGEYTLTLNSSDVGSIGSIPVGDSSKEYEVHGITSDQLRLHEMATLKYSVGDKLGLQDANPDFAEFIADPSAPHPNAVVRSFASTMGRGLAGVITSLDFDYNDSTWDTGELGSRAPIFTTVTFGFTVIHDITPGLDADGFMRAPTHPVGDIVRGTFDHHGQENAAPSWSHSAVE